MFVLFDILSVYVCKLLELNKVSFDGDEEVLSVEKVGLCNHESEATVA